MRKWPGNNPHRIALLEYVPKQATSFFMVPAVLVKKCMIFYYRKNGERKWATDLRLQREFNQKKFFL